MKPIQELARVRGASSSVASIGYDGPQATLEIEFRNALLQPAFLRRL